MSAENDRDLRIQTEVREELEWTPDVDAAGIGVAVDHGTVALSGELANYGQRVAAVKAALRVRGVRAVLDDMTVHPRADRPITETDIAKEVERALRGAVNVPATVKVEIEGHTVRLLGDVDWAFQREAAEKTVHYLRGVYEVDNQIALGVRPSAADTDRRIQRALARNAQLAADSIVVEVVGSTVILTGTVNSFAAKRQAERAAWGSPHVAEVDNRLEIRAG
ncbi:BON domain-containing protein [Microbacterium sp. SYP-A9085]|jgi:osmotically-inducible protein OsmY|uniref:BON domain-containing protein n=1 Tax=Microbacterium sp. SYP-A9085 TaxID=2664454 RepID=UPI00129B1E76|nr:BON domain-containing protein [Microbacterium sp. SYP-A9085]MRH28674.1 BON domain-containing protein [Microbacterium sp. SYP-A9085]